VNRNKTKDTKDLRSAPPQVLLEKLNTLEQSKEPIHPREMVDLLRACIVSRKSHLTELVPRVINVHHRVSGGTPQDGTALLAALSYIGNEKAAFKEYERLKRENIKSFELNYGYLVEACVAAGDLDKAFEVVDTLCNNRHLLIGNLTTFVFNRLVLGCGRLNELDRSEQVFQLLHREGLKPSRTTYAAFVDACSSTGNLYPGLRAVNRMKLAMGVENLEYSLDARWYTSLIPACKAHKDFDRIVAELIREGTPANEDTLEALIAGCTSNKMGGLTRAFGMLQELRIIRENQHHLNELDGGDPVIAKTTKTITKPSLSGSIFTW